MTAIIPAQATEKTSTDIGAFMTRALRGLAWVGAIAIVVFLAIRFGVLSSSFDVATGLVGNDSGLPEGVSRPIRMLLTIVLYTLLIPILFFPINPKLAFLAATAWAILQYAIPIGLEYYARPKVLLQTEIHDLRLFGRKGNALVWYSTGKPCFEIFDAPGVHPVTRERLQPMSPEAAKVLTSCLQKQRQIELQEADIAYRQQKGLLPELIANWNRGLAFFNTVTGEPLIWAARNGDCYDLFKNGKDAFHPQTGAPLIPITKALVVRVIDCKERELSRQQEQLRQQQAAATESTEQQSVAESLHASAQSSLPAAATAPIIQESGAESPYASAQATQPAAATLTVSNNDCRAHRLFLDDRLYGEIPANGGVKSFHIDPGTYSGRVCLVEQPRRCLHSKNLLHLAPGKTLAQRIRRWDGCPLP